MFRCPRITHEWLFNDHKLLSNAIIYPPQVVTIHLATKENQGFYECHGITLNYTSFYARGFLYIRGKYSFICSLVSRKISVIF